MTGAPSPEPDLSFLNLSDGRRLAVLHRAAAAGQATILFLPGYQSDMAGMKASAIDQFCARRGLGCLRLDYSGTGRSPGDFADGTLERWIGEVVAAIDRFVPSGPLVVVGSSMGGWVALHVALRRRQHVAALLGIAAAPDFTDWGFSDEDKQILQRDGRLERLNPHGPGSSVTHAGFWRSGEALKLLDEPIDLPIPVRLVHGGEDRTVPPSVALRLVEQLQSGDVEMRLIKRGGHNLSEPDEIAVLLRELGDLVAKVNPAEQKKEQA